jgi:restriction system protein
MGSVAPVDYAVLIGFGVVAAIAVGVLAWSIATLAVQKSAEARRRAQAYAAEAARFQHMQAKAAEAARQAHLARLRTLDGLLSLSPTEFEEAVAQMLAAHGYRNVQRTGGAGDLAADLVGTAPDGRKTVVQCKRYAPDNLVGSPVLQTFIGMVTVHHRAGLGLFVTTSGFTQPAIQLARDHSNYITLIDGPQVAERMQRLR